MLSSLVLQLSEKKKRSRERVRWEYLLGAVKNTDISD